MIALALAWTRQVSCCGTPTQADVRTPQLQMLVTKVKPLLLSDCLLSYRCDVFGLGYTQGFYLLGQAVYLSLLTQCWLGFGECADR